MLVNCVLCSIQPSDEPEGVAVVSTVRERRAQQLEVT